MTPFELAVLAIFMFIMTGDIGREHRLTNERWWIYVRLSVLMLVAASLVWTVKGILE